MIIVFWPPVHTSTGTWKKSQGVSTNCAEDIPTLLSLVGDASLQTKNPKTPKKKKRVKKSRYAGSAGKTWLIMPMNNKYT